MDQDIIWQLGSLLGKLIPLAMVLVAVAAGSVMVFDAIRMYRNRETKVTSRSPARKEESAADMFVKPSPPARQARAPYAYKQAGKSRS